MDALFGFYHEVVSKVEQVTEPIKHTAETIIHTIEHPLDTLRPAVDKAIVQPVSTLVQQDIVAPVENVYHQAENQVLETFHTIEGTYHNVESKIVDTAHTVEEKFEDLGHGISETYHNALVTSQNALKKIEDGFFGVATEGAKWALIGGVVLLAGYIGIIYIQKHI